MFIHRESFILIKNSNFSNSVLACWGKTSTGGQETTWTRPNLTAYGTLGGGSFACEVSKEHSPRYGWRAFDGDRVTSNSWWALTSPASGWIKFYNPTPIKVKSLTILNSNQSNYTINSGTVYGSNDNSNWTSLTVFSNSQTAASASWTVQVNSNSYYKYYRIDCASTSSYIQIVEIDINATYMATASNAITFPIAFTSTNYSPSIASYGVQSNDSYVLTKNMTGMTLRNNSTVAMNWMTLGY